MTPRTTRGRANRVAASLLGVAVAAPMLLGCRGQRSDEAPIHLNPNMDNQVYVEAQEPSTVFADGRGMRPEVPGTVAIGALNEDEHLHLGLVDDRPAVALPMDLDEELLRRGRERYDIYCTPCHDGAGTGEGIVVKRGMLPPPSFHDDRVRAMPVGELYRIIKDGVRNMPGYAAQIPVEDRWAVAAYVRALQLSRTADLSDVPEDIAASKGWTR